MDGTPPLVSVIVPAYCAAKWISTALDSVLAQTFTDYEITVVNDGSPDTEMLERVLEPYRHHIRYVCQENQGLSGARNTGIRASRSLYIALLDADDIWEPEHLAPRSQSSRQIRLLMWHTPTRVYSVTCRTRVGPSWS